MAKEKRLVVIIGSTLKNNYKKGNNMTKCKAEKKGSKNMSKVKDENYIHIPGWAVTRLGLKGNELLVYSIIYGFSQDGETRFTGSLQYLADWTNSTKQSCIKCLKSLAEKGYITKYEKIVNGVKFCEYQAVKLKSMVVNKVEQGSKQSLTGGIKQSLHNNLDNNTLDNNIVSKKERKSKSKSYDEQITEYTQNEDLQNALKAFLQMRSFIKKPMTEYALKLMLKKLDELGNTDDIKIAILNQSIAHNWQGIFPLKDEYTNQKKQPEKKYDQNGYESEEDLMKMFYGK